jgi:uncharacterized protein (DUF4415 family)
MVARSGSSVPAAQRGRSVRFTPKAEISAAERAMLERLRVLPEAGIDTDDIPEAPRSSWDAAKRPNLYKPLKRSVTIRLDADILEWFQARSGGKGYQTAINRALRGVMDQK